MYVSPCTITTGLFKYELIECETKLKTSFAAHSKSEQTVKKAISAYFRSFQFLELSLLEIGVIKTKCG